MVGELVRRRFDAAAFVACAVCDTHARALRISVTGVEATHTVYARVRARAYNTRDSKAVLRNRAEGPSNGDAALARVFLRRSPFFERGDTHGCRALARAHSATPNGGGERRTSLFSSSYLYIFY